MLAFAINRLQSIRLILIHDVAYSNGSEMTVLYEDIRSWNLEFRNLVGICRSRHVSSNVRLKRNVYANVDRIF